MVSCIDGMVTQKQLCTRSLHHLSKAGGEAGEVVGDSVPLGHKELQTLQGKSKKEIRERWRGKGDMEIGEGRGEGGEGRGETGEGRGERERWEGKGERGKMERGKEKMRWKLMRN